MAVDDLPGGDAAANAAIARAVLAGDPGPARDIVVLNAGAGLYVAGLVGSIADGARRAEAAIDAGEASDLLTRVVERTSASAGD